MSELSINSAKTHFLFDTLIFLYINRLFSIIQMPVFWQDNFSARTDIHMSISYL